MGPQERLFQILDREKSFPLAAYTAIHKGLDYTLKIKRESGHVSGQELALGMAGYLKQEYGPFVGIVLKGWGIHSTLDFGRIVFDLIEAGLMRKQEEDRLDDFENVYNFEEMFRTDVDWLDDIRTELGLETSDIRPSSEKSS
ncbi:MAG: hypothetical protein KC931_01175 [Candidatus Omnitrophica bacterium]|nr:hypothetical protein [Candidatus Omnitrophota bacterium]MCA9416581.1 hypothetical protein [Candidatus Omnitrophota bacterium]MCA9432318.1 hypothetical protein [Candidatus Omnitrophota bacterium]MCA9435099.1 hypothetical protein [Candidatus Omnitrophota bacterium]MCA9440625.1 hypothetical protein [Candidatus Omnitrophota bacterium]